MKPNGKKFAARSVFFVMCVLASLSTIGRAETAHGTFKLPVEAHWGRILLAPGEYEFTVDAETAGKVVTVRSKDTGWSGMILSDETSSVTTANATLELKRCQGGVYVKELCLSDFGLALEFALPGSGKSIALMKPKATTTAAASGLQ